MVGWNGERECFRCEQSTNNHWGGAMRKHPHFAASRKRRYASARKLLSKSNPVSRTNKARIISVSRLPKRSFSARDRSLHALADMRHGAQLSQAARENGVTTRTIKKYVGSALLQDRPGGRIRATKSDRFVRYLQIPGRHGQVEIKVHGSREASEVARYKAAVNRFLRGDLDALAPWRGMKIASVELVTDERTLKEQAQKYELPYALYRSLSGGAV